MKKFLTPKNFLITILVFTAIVRLVRLDYPKGYVFDEVYHAFTAKEYLAGHKEAWEYWTTPPPGVAYEWTHPPVAKELMALSMFILNTTSSFAWRLPGVIFGIVGVYFVYYLAKILFKDEKIGLLSAFIYSLDGLNIVQSRTGMNDIYCVTFMLISLSLFIRKRFALSALMLGLALASKWTALYLFGVYFILLIRYKQLKNAVYFLVIPPLVYISSYLPFFRLGHSLKQLWELQQQMWWYHTNLKATHSYSSPWWSWPFNLYPVWYFVDYLPDGRIANIFASGNPVSYWLSFVAVLVTVYEVIKVFTTHSINLFKNTSSKFEPLVISLIGYFAFILPWALSPRIMFLYHYLPSVPFMSILLGYQLNQIATQGKQKGFTSDRIFVISLLILMFLAFIALYPMLTGIPLPKNIMLLFFKTNITKNPFGP